MLAPPSAGLAPAVEAIARAVKGDRITTLAATLAQLLASGAFDDDRLFVPPHADRYSRNLLWRDPAERFIVLALAWAPGQQSALHDHDGLWGGEIVVCGTMAEQRYRLVDRDGASRYRFASDVNRACARGSVGMLTPPLEYHAFGNAGDSLARTVHVYGGDLNKANVFTLEEGDWYRARQIELPYDG